MTGAPAPDHPPAARPRLTARRGARLAVMLAIALFPILLISVFQASSLLREARARSEAALMGETMRAVAGETRLIQEAQGTARVLARVLSTMPTDAPECSALMRSVTEGAPFISLAAFVPPSGMMTCSSNDAPFDFSGSPLFEKTMSMDGPSFAVNRDGPVSETSILGVIYPVFAATGEKIGIVSLSIPHSTLLVSEDGPQTTGSRPLVIMTFDHEGTILTSSSGLDFAEEQLPRNRSLTALAGPISTTFSAISRRGVNRIYSVVELVPDQLYALGSWPAEDAASFGPMNVLPPMLFPLVMWLGSLLVAYFAVKRLVIRHIRNLGAAIRGFAGGNRVVGHLDMDDAPMEIRQLADIFEKMTETILRDEAELEDILHHKEVLLREVHHRVKNNLQLIASIMNMQMRQARSPEAKELMRGLQERVMSLATIHRGLYQTTGLGDIDTTELLPDIVNQILKLGTGPGHRFDVSTEVDDIRLTPDQAVPLALLLTEAMTNALKYSGNDGPTSWIRVSLKSTGPTTACLSIANSLGAQEREAPPDDANEATGLGSQLLHAFVQQVDGTQTVTQKDGCYELRVDFTVRPLNESEARYDEMQQKNNALA